MSQGTALNPWLARGIDADLILDSRRSEYVTTIMNKKKSRLRRAKSSKKTALGDKWAWSDITAYLSACGVYPSRARLRDGRLYRYLERVKQPYWDFMKQYASSSLSASRALVGLSNPENSKCCWMNSALQLLKRVGFFRDLVSDSAEERRLKALTGEFWGLFLEFASWKEGGVFDTAKHSAILEHSRKMFDDTESNQPKEEDAYEFLLRVQQPKEKKLRGVKVLSFFNVAGTSDDVGASTGNWIMDEHRRADVGRSYVIRIKPNPNPDTKFNPMEVIPLTSTTVLSLEAVILHIAASGRAGHFVTKV